MTGVRGTVPQLDWKKVGQVCLPSGEWLDVVPGTLYKDSHGLWSFKECGKPPHTFVPNIIAFCL